MTTRGRPSGGLKTCPGGGQSWSSAPRRCRCGPRSCWTKGCELREFPGAREMQVLHPPSPGEQRPNVPPRLRALEPPEREPRLGDLGVFGIVRGDHQEQARVGTALVELAGGVEVARAEAKRSGAAERTPPGRPHGLELGGDVRRGCEGREDRKVVAPTGAPAPHPRRS